MFKFTKGFCGFGGSLLSVGLVMLIVGLCLGGRPQGISLGWNNGPVVHRYDIFSGGSDSPAYGSFGVEVPPVNAADIRALSIDIGAANVQVQTGSEFSLRVSDNARYTSTVENGVWCISNDKQVKFLNGPGPQYRITVPASFLFEDVALNIGAGNLEATGLRTATSDVNVGAGNVTLNDFTATGECYLQVGMGTLKINGDMQAYNSVRCGMGTVKLLLDRPSEYGYSTSVGMGTVKVDGNGNTGIGSDLNHNSGATCFFDIECGMGTVKVEFRDNATQETTVTEGTGAGRSEAIAEETVEQESGFPSPPAPPQFGAAATEAA